MSATASVASPSNLGEVQVLRHQARAIHHVLLRNVDGITHEESLHQPEPGGNCLNWVLGHLVSTYDVALPILGQESVFPKGTLERYARRSAPIEDGSQARDFAELVAAWTTAAERWDAGLAGLSAEGLDRPAPFSPGNDPNETVRSLLSLMNFHQSYHVGQLGLLRRLIGKEGAIR
jgi:uncharacterized damage-inducible protein DinB